MHMNLFISVSLIYVFVNKSCSEVYDFSCFLKNGKQISLCICENNTFSCGLELYDYVYHYLHKYSSDNFKTNNKNLILTKGEFSPHHIERLEKDKLLPKHESTIEKLNFYENHIYLIENGTFDKFILLKELNIGYNTLTSIDEMILSETLGKTLEILNLSRNKFEKMLPSTAFKNLKKITSLDLSHNKHLLFPNDFKLPSTLKFLDLSHCDFEYLNDEIFLNLKALETLWLSGNLFLSVPKALKPLSNLISLKMEATKIKLIDDYAFCGLLKLEKMNLNKNRELTFIHENAFGEANNICLPNLTMLSLLQTNLTLLPQNLIEMKKIEEIHFDINDFNCSCSLAWLVKDVKRALPIIANKIGRFPNKRSKKYLYCSNFKKYMEKISGFFCNTTYEN